MPRRNYASDASPTPANRRRLLPNAYPQPEHPMNLRDRGGAPEFQIPLPPPPYHHNTNLLVAAANGRPSPSLKTLEQGSEMSGADPSRGSEGSSWEPFLNLTVDHRVSRVWESRGGLNHGEPFEIWEDDPDAEPPNPPTPPLPTDRSEEKENLFLTSSDYGSDNEEQENDPRRQNIDFDVLNDRRIDAYGPPVPSRVFNQLTIDSEGNVVRHTPQRRTPVPLEFVRPAVRIEIIEQNNEVDENDENDESDDDSGEEADEPMDLWDESLEENQIRELEELTDVHVRAHDQRQAHGRQEPMRDSPSVQGPASLYLEARRITMYQRQQARRRNRDIVDYGDEDDDL
ncbi:uncharacterized protein N7483_010249 [Penicillium malachiteum]|uniref:uncharacterized protein n=1 Tax=Penicillium malachiteum TaxID=1324776 RepID=UPI00254799C7|nr:uncharacterized protein N7483_010249 [Penicillium malachiteum]KAJ5713068.1 hypothetical protein N7483_010249 [Penicillium malachiteum]